MMEALRIIAGSNAIAWMFSVLVLALLVGYVARRILNRESEAAALALGPKVINHRRVEEA